MGTGGAAASVRTREPMGAKKAKTAQKTSTQQKHVCPDCGSEARIVMYAGYGDRGLFWVCEKSCGYKQRTR